MCIVTHKSVSSTLLHIIYTAKYFDLFGAHRYTVYSPHWVLRGLKIVHNQWDRYSIIQKQIDNKKIIFLSKKSVQTVNISEHV